MVAAIAIVAVSLLDPGSLVAARGDPIIISEQLVIVPTPGRRMVVCQDEAQKLSLDVFVKVIYRMPTDPRGRRRVGSRAASANVRVQATSSNPSRPVAVAAPPFIDFPPGSNPQTMEITGDQLGTATLTLQDTVGLAQPVTISVSVVECVIKVRSTSRWNMNFNYALTAYGTMPEVTLRRTGPGRYSGQGTMSGSASASSIGGCIPRYTIGSSTATLTGGISGSAGNQILDVRASYSPMSVATDVVCIAVGGGRADTGHPVSVAFRAQAFEQRKVVAPVPHEVNTGRGLQPGNTEFVVWTEEVVPAPP